MNDSDQVSASTTPLYSLAIHRWAIGRPAMIASMAQQAATAVSVMQGLIGLIRSGQAARVVNESCGATDWLHLYRDPRAFRQVLISEFQADPDPRECAFLLDFFAKRLPNMGQINTEVLDHAPPEALAIAEVTHDRALCAWDCGRPGKAANCHQSVSSGI